MFTLLSLCCQIGAGSHVVGRGAGRCDHIPLVIAILSGFSKMPLASVLCKFLPCSRHFFEDTILVEALCLVLVLRSGGDADFMV